MSHSDLHISLGLDVRPPACVGWVLDVRQGEGYDPVVDRVPVPPDVAVQIAELLDRHTGTNRVSQAVRANNAAAVSRLDDLAAAAAAAAVRAEVLAGKAADFRSGMASPQASTDETPEWSMYTPAADVVVQAEWDASLLSLDVHDLPLGAAEWDEWFAAFAKRVVARGERCSPPVDTGEVSDTSVRETVWSAMERVARSAADTQSAD